MHNLKENISIIKLWGFMVVMILTTGNIKVKKSGLLSKMGSLLMLLMGMSVTEKSLFKGNGTVL